MQQLFIGVDGGATKCIVRLEDESGQLLGRDISGPANIRLSPVVAWESIYSALNNVLRPLSLSLATKSHHFHAGMGLAGSEVQEAYQSFIAQTHPFQSLTITSDAHTACLGAHRGQDGAIVIAGTGVVGWQIEANEINKVSGWGFPHDDAGGGAWLGLEAVKITLQSMDGRLPVSGLSTAVYAFFSNDLHRLVTWANQANSTAFAELAPLVIQQSQTGDAAAIQLLKQAAQAIDRVAAALADKQQQSSPLPCALVGGIAPFLEPYLGQTLRGRLRPCQATPEEGAILLVRHYLKEKS